MEEIGWKLEEYEVKRGVFQFWLVIHPLKSIGDWYERCVVKKQGTLD